MSAAWRVHERGCGADIHEPMLLVALFPGAESTVTGVSPLSAGTLEWTILSASHPPKFIKLPPQEVSRRVVQTVAAASLCASATWTTTGTNTSSTTNDCKQSQQHRINTRHHASFSRVELSCNQLHFFPLLHLRSAPLSCALQHSKTPTPSSHTPPSLRSALPGAPPHASVLNAVPCPASSASICAGASTRSFFFPSTSTHIVSCSLSHYPLGLISLI